jgi:PAS domain S-box-containing protein
MLLCCTPAVPAAAPGVEADILDALSDNLPISLVALSVPDLSVVTANRQARSEFGREGAPAALPLPADLDTVFGPGARQALLPTLRDVVRGGQPAEHDLAWPGSQGQRIVTVRHIAVRMADGRVGLVISLLRDISARRRAEIELLESELRFKELVEAIEDGVFVSTPQRDSMLYTSRRFGDLWGFGEDEMRDDPACFARRVHPQDLSHADEHRQRETRSEPTDQTFRIHHPQRGLRWLRQRTRTRVLPTGEARVYGVVSDVTEEREHALQLQAARDAAEAASEAKSQFMANMSHEIRTPMNGVLGMTELLMGTPLNERQRRFAQAVYRSAENLLEIINDILDFAKIEAGRLEVVHGDFSPRTVVEDTLELLAPRAHEKGLELSFHEIEPGPAWVSGDALRLRQVLTNLVANAIKFTERGEVSVRLRTRALAGPVGEGLELSFEVRDSGIGIAADVLPRLFSAFSQGHEGMARRYGGTGLGLAISRQLVQLMGGRIEVESQPGIGSVFRFGITVGAAQHSAAVEDTEAMPALRVLVVDDNETNRTVLEDLLGRWHMDCVSAIDGQAALELLREPGQRAFDLALVDGRMPRVDGLQFARRVAEEGLQPQMQMMMLSSTAGEDVRAALDEGYARFIAKPVRQAELRQAILGVRFAGSAPAEADLPRFDAEALVVEDNPVNQEVIRQMLLSLGCRVQVASSAMAGLHALTERRYDLVLMDIQMPGMDGIEALRWFRSGRGGRFEFLTPGETPVIAVTANALAGDDKRFLSLGFDDYLSKPFRQRQLVALLRRFLPPGGAPRCPLAPKIPPGRKHPEAAR